MNAIMNRFGYRALVGATTALLAAVTVSAASAQTTYFACRVPGVNIIYIRGNLVSDPCIDAAHVQFQWTDGGAPGANSVNSAAIIDGTIAVADHGAGSVNSAAIVDGTVAAADLAAGLVAGVEFGKDFANFDPTTTATTATSLSLSHPASGFIVAHALGQVLCSADASVLLGISNNTTAVDFWTNYVGYTGNYTFVHKQDVFPVTGAGTATVNFNVQISGADNCTYFRALNFDAIYVPVRY
jgi:hypothetical protein